MSFLFNVSFMITHCHRWGSGLLCNCATSLPFLPIVSTGLTTVMKLDVSADKTNIQIRNDFK